MLRYLILYFLFHLSSWGAWAQVANCPDDCDGSNQEDIVTYAAACYDCDNNRLNLTRWPDSIGGAVYEEINVAGFSAKLDVLEGFRLPLRVNFGDREDGREGFAFVLAPNQADIRPNGKGGYMGYRNVPGSLAFVFDIHNNQEPPFNENRPFDELRLVAGGMLDSILRDSIPILAPVRAGYENVETGRDIAVLITYDSRLKLLEVHVDRFHRFTHKIDLYAFFEQERIISMGALGASGPNPTNIQLGLGDNTVFFNRNVRQYDRCGMAENFLNWVHGSPTDNGAWAFNAFLDKVTQQLPGRPALLQTPFPLMEAEIELTINTLSDYLAANGNLRPNDHRNAFGIGIGIRQPYAQFNRQYKGLLIDWMGDGELVTTGGGAPGIYFSRLDGRLDPVPFADNRHVLATRTESEAYEILDTHPTPSWDVGRTYKLRVQYRSDSLRVAIRDSVSGETIYDRAHPHEGVPGAFALYNYRQPGIRYRNFDYRLLHSFCADRDSICPREEISFTYEVEKTPRLALIAQDAYWDFGDGVTQPGFAEGRILTGRHRYRRSGDWPVTLFVVDSSGCAHPYVDTIHVRPGPLIEFGPDTTLCFGDTLFLFPGETLDSLRWQDGSLNSFYTVTEADTIIATSIGFGECIVSDTLEVNYRDELQYIVEVLPDCSLEMPGSVEVIPSAGTLGLTARLNGENGLVHRDLPGGRYQLEVGDVFGCQDSVRSLSVAQGIGDIPTTTVIPESCTGVADGQIRVVDPASDWTIRLDEMGESTQGIFVGLTSDRYLLEIRDTLGCRVSDTITVGIRDSFRITGLTNTTIELGESVTLSPLLSFGLPAVITWSPEEGLTEVDSLEVVASPLQLTRYTLLVESVAGCVAEAAVTIAVDNNLQLYMPTAFSPNFDGDNDYYYPMAEGIRRAVASIESLTIYNRWGRVVFHREGFMPDGPAYGWDGRVDGRPLGPQEFTYLMTWRKADGVLVPQVGSFSLLR